MAKSLLQESQQNGDNDARLQGLTETDEEDCGTSKGSALFSSPMNIKDSVSLLGTANTLTVIAKDCDGRMEWN